MEEHYDAATAPPGGGEPLRVGWVGTGVMGGSMARHLLDAGHHLTVTTRTKAKAAELLAAGAAWADTPAEVAIGADVIATMVGYPSDVREVVLGADGTLGAASAGTLLVDFTTSSPALAAEIFTEAARRDVDSLDAPVSGGDVGARNATLSIMVGGSAAAFTRARPVLDLLGATVVHHGPAGSGQHAKMVNQILVAGTMVGLSEALLYSASAGLDANAVLESVSGGAAASWALTNLAPRVIADDLSAGFYVEHFVKDLGIAIDEANTMRLQLPGLALARRLYVELADSGDGRLGTQALVRALARLSDREWPPD